jgi:hypothetical protein
MADTVAWNTFILSRHYQSATRLIGIKSCGILIITIRIRFEEDPPGGSMAEISFDLLGRRARKEVQESFNLFMACLRDVGDEEAILAAKDFVDHLRKALGISGHEDSAIAGIQILRNLLKNRGYTDALTLLEQFVGACLRAADFLAKQSELFKNLADRQAN